MNISPIGKAWTGNYKLAVNGPIIATEMKVQLQGVWPDYVFKDDYNLMSIDSLKTYLLNNNHLPDVPSSINISENDGFNVGEMNTILLKKIEELTLYIIDLNSKYAALKSEEFNKE